MMKWKFQANRPFWIRLHFSMRGSESSGLSVAIEFSLALLLNHERYNKTANQSRPVSYLVINQGELPDSRTFTGF